MKKFNISMLSILMFVLAISCHKYKPFPDPEEPIPGDTSTIRSFRFVFDSLPGQTAVMRGMSVIVTVINHNNVAVLENKKYVLQYDGKYKSPVISLYKGTYRISSLMVTQGDTAVRFVTPKEGTLKAQLVTKPLAVAFTLNEKIEKNVGTELLAVTSADNPINYGYPAGTFGNPPGGGEEDPGPQDVRIFVRPQFKIGEIMYDSVPASLQLRSYDAQNNMTLRIIPLSAGTHELLLPVGAVRYKLSVSKWGTYDEIELRRDTVRTNTLYTIGGSRDAKKLKTVYTYKLINGTSTPETKTDYEYEANGHMKQIIVYAKRNNNETYIFRKELFEYQDNRIRKILAYDEHNNLVSTSSFVYNAQGKITTMEEIVGTVRTSATVYYTNLPDGDHRIEAQYTHSDHYYTTYLTKTFHGGNLLASVLHTSHGDGEEGLYGHDASINPYAHLQIPDMFFSNYSKNNMNYQSVIRVNLFPQFVPRNFTYTYNGDGYPTELQTQYYTYLTNQYAHTIKTVYNYY